MLISKLAKHGDILNHFYLHHLDSVLLEVSHSVEICRDLIITHDLVVVSRR